MTPATSAVFRELLRRELGERYRGSLLGATWLLLLPLLQLAVLSWVFGRLLVSRGDSGDLPYAAFLALGLWPWNLFANALNRGVGAFTENAALIGRVAVPHALYLHARVAASVLIDLVGFLLVLIVLRLIGTPLHFSGVPVALAALAILAVFALAAAGIAAVLQVFLRDIAPAITQLLSLGFFLTPVLYARARMPIGVQDWLAFNPLAAPVEALRTGLSQGGADAAALAVSAAVAVALWLLSRGLLARARPHLEDFL